MIHVLDNDPRQITDKENYPLNHGSFSEVAMQLNRALKELGHYAEPDNAEWVGACDGLNVGFKYKNKKSFVIHVWEASSLPKFVFHVGQGQRIFGLSDQITNLWHKYGREDVTTVYGGSDFNFWKPTVPKNPNQFQFCHVNSSNVRSGLDMSIQAYARAFAGNKNVVLKIKDTNPQAVNSRLEQQIEIHKKYYDVNIEYYSSRQPATYIRDLYSESHVTLNALRATSFGMPLIDCAACGSLSVTTDLAPMNELVDENTGVLIPASEDFSLQSAAGLVDSWGLLNCYGHFEYLESPLIGSINIADYAFQLHQIYHNWHIYSNKDLRTPIINKWDWKLSAQSLVKNLYGK